MLNKTTLNLIFSLDFFGYPSATDRGTFKPRPVGVEQLGGYEDLCEALETGNKTAIQKSLENFNSNASLILPPPELTQRLKQSLPENYHETIDLLRK